MSPENYYDEFLNEKGKPRSTYTKFHSWFLQQRKPSLKKRIAKVEEIFRTSGISFNLSDDVSEDERVIPFDVIPRIIAARDWEKIEMGIKQRVQAINLFLKDIYSSQKILRDKIIPTELILRNSSFLPQMIGIKIPNDIYAHISGVDIVRTGASNTYVLEDNVRVPSGVSYMLENRETMMHLFPELFSVQKIKEINSYPVDLSECLLENSPLHSSKEPTVALLTPGTFNSAYFEHAFLADQMSAELVQAGDLILDGKKITMRTINGLKPIDILYRRVDDFFLDPLSFNQDSLLGIPGLMEVFREGGITIANSPGTGVADDKAVYSFIPKIIKYYLDQDPILRNVRTFRCAVKNELDYVLSNINKLVIKEVHGSGGKGMLVGPAASKKETEEFKLKVLSYPERYIAQPTLALSTCQIITNSGLSPRHIDLRPFALASKNKIRVTAGGLTRVALKKGSLVVNSSQGGGTKDTWIVES